MNDRKALSHNSIYSIMQTRRLCNSLMVTMSYLPRWGRIEVAWGWRWSLQWRERWRQPWTAAGCVQETGLTPLVIVILQQGVRETQQQEIVRELLHPSLGDVCVLAAHGAGEVTGPPPGVAPHIVLEAAFTKGVQTRQGFGAAQWLQADLARQEFLLQFLFEGSGLPMERGHG